MYADTIFPELEKELKRNPSIIGNTKGYFEILITNKKATKKWYILLKGKQSSVSTTPLGFTPNVKMEISDNDLLKIITGGLSGFAAFEGKKLKIEGDLILAQEVEDIFTKKAGGIKRVNEFIRKKYPEVKSRL